jgi:hypothetical protein
VNRTVDQIADDAIRAAYRAGWEENKQPFRITRDEFRALMMQPFEWRMMLGMALRIEQPRTICGLPLDIVP